MAALTAAAILILFLTAVMWAVEEYDRMRRRARETRREEHYEELCRRNTERAVTDAVEDLRWELDLYDAQGFLWLEEEGRND